MKVQRLTNLSLRRFELLQVPHQETILPLNQKLNSTKLQDYQRLSKNIKRLTKENIRLKGIEPL